MLWLIYGFEVYYSMCEVNVLYREALFAVDALYEQILHTFIIQQKTSY